MYDNYYTPDVATFPKSDIRQLRQAYVGLSGIVPEGFPTRYACGNDTKE